MSKYCRRRGGRVRRTTSSPIQRRHYQWSRLPVQWLMTQRMNLLLCAKRWSVRFKEDKKCFWYYGHVKKRRSTLWFESLTKVETCKNEQDMISIRQPALLWKMNLKNDWKSGSEDIIFREPNLALQNGIVITFPSVSWVSLTCPKLFLWKAMLPLYRIHSHSLQGTMDLLVAVK